jgi:positive phototaxis protein PixI
MNVVTNPVEESMRSSTASTVPVSSVPVSSVPVSSSALAESPKAGLAPKSLLTLGTGYLRMSLLEGVSVLLPLTQVQEVIALPSHRLSALPNLPAPVLGLMNRRSQVLWLVDLAYLLGMGRLELDSLTHHVVVLKVGSISFGVAVKAIEGMISLNNDALVPLPPQVPPSAMPYLKSCARIAASDANGAAALLMVLNPDALIQSPVLQIQS